MNTEIQAEMQNGYNLPRLAIFGAGGLGIEMIALLEQRYNAKLVAILDKNAYAYSAEGLNLHETYQTLSKCKEVSALTQDIELIHAQDNCIHEFMKKHSQDIDVIFYALPNLPNTFIPEITDYIALQTDYCGVIVDAIKRTSAVKQLLTMHDKLQKANILYLTGCGATPGLLTIAAVIGAQSFAEVSAVDIRFGVGIANWQAYRATIREDIAHMPGYDTVRANQMTDAEVEALLEQTNGLITLENMEHADDIMLERAGICRADQVKVGGIVDTRNPKKPLSTHITITGKTYQGLSSSHTFTLGDETTMAANVNGTVLGYINAGILAHHEYHLSGIYTAADILPRYAPVMMKIPNLV